MGMDLSRRSTEFTGATGTGLVLLQNDRNFLNRPGFQVMETTKRLNELNVQVNKSSYLPTLAYSVPMNRLPRETNSISSMAMNRFETFLVSVQLECAHLLRHG